MTHRILMGLSKQIPNRLVKEVKQFENLLVLDFEATCIKNKIIKPQEVIEFPCLVVSTADWQVKDAFHEYVKPREHPQLSEFCSELTGILQEHIDNEDHFPEVLSKFCEWLEDGKYFDKKDKSAFVTCGDWDLKVLLKDQCQLDGIEMPSYFKEWINLKTQFSIITNYYPRSLMDMLKHLNMQFEGKHHCGIDDAHNIARIIRYLGERYKPQFTITTKMEKSD